MIAGSAVITTVWSNAVTNVPAATAPTSIHGDKRLDAKAAIIGTAGPFPGR